ncbi:MAG: hypothetical protein COA67_00920 [Lutibacter sp.]|nr:MAG: hypothetical protein COA67_00920 [Lutibacter sp.]
MKKLKVTLGIFAIAGVFALTNSTSSNIEDLNQKDELTIKKRNNICSPDYCGLSEGHGGRCIPENG